MTRPGIPAAAFFAGRSVHGSVSGPQHTGNVQLGASDSSVAGEAGFDPRAVHDDSCPPLDLRLRQALCEPELERSNLRECGHCGCTTFLTGHEPNVEECTSCGECHRAGVHIAPCVACMRWMTDLLVCADGKLRCDDCDEELQRGLAMDRAHNDYESSQETSIECWKETRGLYL